ncbi:MAG: hypothetical protein IPN05_08575 [Sulfuritalea sp.]|nr:hypothetical protein [Gemmatimonadota bacterium]MBK9350227.1 hypothetical protein [Sulfuritalea sp.]
MADDQPPGSPGKFINDIEAGMRKEFTARIESVRAQVREARDRADAEKICAQKANEEMTRRMAEYRRGRLYDVAAVVTSAASGFTAGYHTQKHADLRIGGAPVAAVAGVPGVLAGALLDESVVTRSVFAVGGTMFMVGATAYALIHPQGQGG